MLSKDGQSMEKLPVQGKLLPGARYAAKVQLGAPAYVYMVQKAGPGNWRLIYPEPGHEAHRFDAQAPVRIPDEPWLDQAPAPGAESLVLVTSPAPLSEGQVLAAAMVPGDPTPPVTEGKRGDPMVRVAQDPRRVTVARFSFSRTGEGEAR